MKTAKHTRAGRLQAWSWATLISLTFLSGCIETKVQVRVDADGSGTRRIEMAWEENMLEDVDVAVAQLVREISPQLVRLIEGRNPSAAEIESMTTKMHEIFDHDDGMNEQLERDLPGLSLLAFTILKLEVRVPGIIVESNADRVGEGYAAWEGPIWDAINAPREFVVRSRLEN